MEKLYKYHVNCGRNGSISGLFIANEEDVKNIIGEYVYLGEVLGKHSEVSGTIEEDDITEIEISNQTIKELKEKIGESISGYNPFDYIEYTCSVCGDKYRFDDMDWHATNDGKHICDYCTKEE